MQDTWFLRFVWGPRRENPSHIAARLHRFLVEFEEIGRIRFDWRRNKIVLSLSETEKGVEQLRGWLSAGVPRRDVGNDQMTEVGYSTTLTGETEGGRLTLRVNCGASSEWVNNVLSVDFTEIGKVGDALICMDVLLELAKRLVELWEPEHGVVTTYQCSTLVDAPRVKSEAGWITFVLDDALDRAELPKTAAISKCGKGWLVVSTQDRLTGTNHIEAVRGIARCIR